MKNKRVPSYPLLLLICAMVIAAGATAVFARTSRTNGQSATSESAWAESVVGHKLGPGAAVNYSDPTAAIGPVDSRPVALGNAQIAAAAPQSPTSCEAYIILGFGEERIIDGEGDDITVREVLSGGLAEATWVYIGGGSLADGSWRFVGQADGGISTLDIGHVAGANEYFNLVGICDVPDGNTTIWPAPGPDIDAVAATNTGTVGLVVEASGPGWSLNYKPLPFKVETPFQPGDVIRFQCRVGTPISECNAFLTIKAKCGGTARWTVIHSYWIMFVSLRELIYGYEGLYVDDLYAICGDPDRALAQDTQAPVSTFTLQKGGMSYAIEQSQYRFEVQTPAAGIFSSGRNAFTAAYDPAAKQAQVTVTRGRVLISPTAPGADPFTLTGGQIVTIGPSGPGPVSEFQQIYMPLALGP